MPGSVVKHSEHWAWQPFIMLHWSASTSGRGVPNAGKKFGDPGKTVWETWKEPVEVYLAGGSQTLGWDVAVNSIPGSSTLRLLLSHEKGLHRGSKVGHKSPLLGVLNQSSADQAREFFDSNGQPTYCPLDFVWSLIEAHSIKPTAKRRAQRTSNTRLSIG